jgi:hypothetical protein
VEFNTEILRWFLLLASAPIWLPFLKALLDDFNSTLAEDGGIFGRTPSRAERERILSEKAKQPDVLISEPWTRRGESRSARSGSASNTSGGGAPAPRKRSGFR